MEMKENDKEILRRMLSLNELPDFIEERYFDIKKMTDKVDGRLTAVDLARIALDCGFNPKTMLFDRPGDTDQFVAQTNGEIADIDVTQKEKRIPLGRKVVLTKDGEKLDGKVIGYERDNYKVKLSDDKVIRASKEEIEVVDSV